MVLQYSNIFPFLACNGSWAGVVMEMWRERSGWSLGTPWHHHDTVMITMVLKTHHNVYTVLQSKITTTKGDLLKCESGCFCLRSKLLPSRNQRRRVCFSPWRRATLGLKIRETIFWLELIKLFPLISYSRFSPFFLPWNKEKIILNPKTERRKRGKASGNNRDFVGEAYCKSAKNLTAALVPTAWAL